MSRFGHFIGGLFLFTALTMHFLLVAFLISPVSKLLPISYGYKIDVLDENLITDELEGFILSNNIPLNTISVQHESWLRRMNHRWIQFRKDKFMDSKKAIALDLSLLNFGEDVIGLGAASQYYYNQPIEKIDHTEWKTLIGLHSIFSK